MTQIKSLWHLDYEIDRAFHRDAFYYLIDKHRDCHPLVPTWQRVFKEVHCQVEITELNLEGLNVFPRYSFIPKGTGLPPHKDEDEIIGINFTLHDHPITIHLEGKPYEYEAAVIDVGHVTHSVEPVDYDRLMLKFAIREPLDVVLERTHDKIIK